MTINAYGLAKQIFVWRVVLIDQELIRKIEAHPAKRIPIARWLIYSDRAVAVSANSQANAREGSRISGESRKVFVSDNGRRYIPRRIERDVLYRLCQHGSCVLPRLTDNNARRPYRFAILHDRQGVVREIYHHIGSTQFPRQPTPALHISKDGINSRSRNLGLTTPFW